MSDFPFRMSHLWFGTEDGESGDRTSRETEQGPDRAAGIVGAAFVEDHLTDAIKRTVAFDQSLFNEMFSPERGLLGSFGAKIRVGFLIGLYDGPLRTELDTISRVRNRFAHHREADSFASEKIAGLVGNLTAGEKLRLGVTRLEGEQVYLRLVYAGDQQPRQGEAIRPFIPSGATLRQRFTATCAMFAWLLSLAKGPGFRPLIGVSENTDAP